MGKSVIFVGICGFFVSYASLAYAESDLAGCSGSMHVSAAQVCSLDDHFNVPGKSLICLGDVTNKSRPEHSRSLYADVEPGIYSSGISPRFETFDGYEMECTARGFCE